MLIEDLNQGCSLLQFAAICCNLPFVLLAAFHALFFYLNYVCMVMFDYVWCIVANCICNTIEHENSIIYNRHLVLDQLITSK